MKRIKKNHSKLLKGQDEFKNLPAKFIYMNNGTEGSMPGCVIKAYKKNLIKWTSNPTTSYETDPLLGKREKKNRKKVAQFLGVQLNNICLTDNTTMGLSMVLMGLNFRPKDRVIITDHEHPAITSPLWLLKQKQGVEVEVRSFPSTKILRQMNSDDLLDCLFPVIPELQFAKALCVSHIYNTNGVRLPLDKLKKRAEELHVSYLIVDGAQAAGMVDLIKPENRVDNCDFYAAPSHKWMNGPPGTGLLYIRNSYLTPPEFYPTITQKMGAYMCGDYPGSFLPIAEALQVRGCSNIPGYVAVTRLLKFYEEIGGQAKIEKHILALSCSVRDFIASKSPDCLISPSDPELQSGLVSFYPFNWDEPESCFMDRDTVIGVNNKLLDKGVQVRYVPFPTVDFAECLLQKHEPELLIDCSGEPVEQTFCIRVSTGYFNTADEVDMFKKALEKVLTGLSSKQDEEQGNNIQV